jgi:hypothetical protein
VSTPRVNLYVDIGRTEVGSVERLETLVDGYLDSVWSTPPVDRKTPAPIVRVRMTRYLWNDRHAWVSGRAMQALLAAVAGRQHP